MDNASRAYTIRSEPRRELTVRQRENTEKLFPGSVLRFETMVTKTQLKAGSWETLSDGEILISQDWKSVNNPFQAQIATGGLLSFFDKGSSIYRNNSIVLLTGPGGAGKTHFVRYLHDQLRHLGRQVFFLTAHSVRISEPDLTVSSLYDIYKLSIRDDISGSVISRELFDLNFCVSDPAIIVDGLEEIITMLGDRFRVSEFFDDCRSKAEQLANGKIVITTREHSWPSEIESYADQFELSLFDKKKIQEYFDAFFEDNQARASLALKIFHSMNDKQDVAPPLICKLVATELDNEIPESEYQSKLDRGEFASVDGLNGIIDGFISREKKLGVTWSLPETNIALGRLAVEAVGGPVDFSLAKKILSVAFLNSIPTNLDAAIRNFILLRYNEATNSVTFRYDFVQTLFLARHIIKCIETIDISILEQEAGIALFARRLTPGSDVSRKIISTQQENLPENFFAILEQVIDDVASQPTAANSPANPYEARQIISNLLFLRIVADRSGKSINDNTNILKSIFSKDDGAQHLQSIAVMRFDQGQENTVKFDLRGFKLKDCWFEDTSLDEMIVADDKTSFSNCDFVRALSNKPSPKASIWKAKFDSKCRLGPRFETKMRANSASVEATTERKIEELARFLGLFAMPSGHSFSKIWTRSALFGTFSTSLGYGAEHYTNELKRRNLLQVAKGHGGNKIELTTEGRKAARNLVLDSIVSAPLKEVLNTLR